MFLSIIEDLCFFNLSILVMWRTYALNMMLLILCFEHDVGDVVISLEKLPVTFSSKWMLLKMG